MNHPTSEIQAFKKKVVCHFQKLGRTLPWRSTPTQYRVVVSEIMLQQTQVTRVLPKFEEFIHTFPNWKSLAASDTSQLLRVWSGLGYNRRALALRKIAKIVAQNGTLPRTMETLRELPGIGPNTAGSILAFAFNQPVVFIETNIRSVFIHHFFEDRTDIADSELLPLIEATLDQKHPREWYSALMDYGSWLKQQTPNPSRKSATHVTQTKFKGSLREARGAVVKHLLSRPNQTVAALAKATHIDRARIVAACEALKKEGTVIEIRKKFNLAP